MHPSTTNRRTVPGKLQLAVMLGCLTLAANAAAQDGPVHRLHAGIMPPGAIGRQRLLRGGPLSGYTQPVAIRAPQGARVAPAVNGSFAQPQTEHLLVGLYVGAVYRFRVTDIPEYPGVEVFPTVELIDRMYPPMGQALKFPVPVDLTVNELLLAAEGKFVTRVIYIEDPQLAIPIAEKTPSETRWIDVQPGGDPLVAADSLGRPIAILRMGSLLPDQNQQADPMFLCGSPPLVVFDAPPTAGPATGDLIIAPHEAPIE